MSEQNSRDGIRVAGVDEDQQAGDGGQGGARGSAGGAQPAPEGDEGASAPVVAVVELSGPEDGRATPIFGGTGLIGRLADDLTVRLPYDQWVSRRHARLTYRDGQWWIEDLHSSNGTSVDGGRSKIDKPTAIALEQVFRIGHTDLMLSDDRAHVSQHSVHV